MYEIERVVAERGCKYIDSADGLVSGQFYMISVVEDATFTTLKEQGDIDVLSEINISGKTVPAGSLISARRVYFESIQLSAGKIIAYRYDK
ncbi:hypothetical protein WJR50_18850 [Catalinimonas sp. 4WD22]|uniref:hypothetical protein n=1 Tax=Catalinimonas locisalis TaxID=3133978 RepID=UPI003101989C